MKDKLFSHQVQGITEQELKTDSAVMEKYGDIIGLSRPVSGKRKPMEMMNRAAQFGSFDALKGFSESIEDMTEAEQLQAEWLGDLRYLEDNC